MNCMLPQALIDTLRLQQSIILDRYGVDCTLYIVRNLDSIQNLDAYQEVGDRAYTSVATKVFVNWNENQYNLRKLGLYTEDGLPITAQFKYSLVIPVGSYFSFTVNYPNGQDTKGVDIQTSDVDEFEIINRSTNGMRETVVFPTYSIAPRRK